MSIISRLSLPEEFFDSTSDRLLIQPEPQYVYANLWKTAMAADLAMPGELGLAGRQIMEPAKAAYASLDEGRLQLASQIMSDALAGKVNMQGLPGHTLRFNRPSFTDSTYTLASRQITPDMTISTTGMSVSSEQSALTLALYSGPYSSGVKPYAISALDASVGVHKLAQIVGTNLKRDFDKFIESVIVSLMDTAATTIYPNSMTADNDATATGSFPMDMDTLLRAEEKLNSTNIPTFADGFRCLVLTPTQVRQLSGDPAYVRYAQFFKEFNVLMPGYVASVSKLHIFMSNTLTVTANNSSVNIHKGHAFGPGAVGVGMGRRPRVAYSTANNYGETVLVVWLADLAFGLFDNRFVVDIHTSA